MREDIYARNCNQSVGNYDEFLNSSVASQMAKELREAERDIPVCLPREQVCKIICELKSLQFFYEQTYLEESSKRHELDELICNLCRK